MTVGVGERRRSRRLAAPRNDATVHLIVGDDRTLRHVNLGRLILRAPAGQSGGRNRLPVGRGWHRPTSGVYTGPGARSCDIWSLSARSPSDNCAAKASLTLTMLTHGGRTLPPTVHQLVGMTDVTWRLVVAFAFCTLHFLPLPVDARNCIVRGQWCEHGVHVTLLSFTTCNAKILARFVKHPLYSHLIWNFQFAADSILRSSRVS